MDVWSTLPKKASKNQFNIVINDRYTKLARTLPSLKTTVKQDVLTFFDHWFKPYEIPPFIAKYSSLQILNKFFETECAMLNVMPLKNTSKNLQAKC